MSDQEAAVREGLRHFLLNTQQAQLMDLGFAAHLETVIDSLELDPPLNKLLGELSTLS